MDGCGHNGPGQPRKLKKKYYEKKIEYCTVIMVIVVIWDAK